MSIFLPVLFTLIISCAVGLCTLQTPMGFAGGFGLSLVLHFIIGGLFNTYIQYRNNKEMEQLEAEKITEITKQTLKLTCPCDRGIEQTVPLFFNRDNKYNCAMCSKLIKCAVSVKPTLVTEIFDLDESQNNLIMQMQEKIKQNIADE